MTLVWSRDRHLDDLDYEQSDLHTDSLALFESPRRVSSPLSDYCPDGDDDRNVYGIAPLHYDTCACDTPSFIPPICLQKNYSAIAVRHDLSCRWRLRSVCHFFKEVVDSEPVHRFYLNQILCELLQLPYVPTSQTISDTFIVSVARLIRSTGKYGELSVTLRSSFQNPRWYSAWLKLKNAGFGWFTVVNVDWK